MNMKTTEHTAPSWASLLVDEDWQFVRRFLLASGSLKELAEQYGISYPTIRIRMDRLIEKVREADKTASQDEFGKLVRSFVIDGHISQFVAKEILRAHQQNKGGGK